jgi:DNA-binding beta-propeller fold protein YncE
MNEVHHLTRKLLLALLLITFTLAVAQQPADSGPYQLRQKYVLGGEGGWDYLTYDAAGKRLFISRGTHVQVVDPAKGTVIGDIPDTTGVHGIALAQDLGKGFTSNGGGTGPDAKPPSVTVFDLKTLKVTSKINLPDDAKNPDAILYDPASKRVFTFNGRSKNASVIDADKGTVVATIPLDGKPEFAAADGKGMVFVNIEDKAELTSIDAKKATVVTSWPLTGCEDPSGLAIDRKNRRLFAGCRNKVMAIVNADSGQVVATVPIGQGVDANEFDPTTQIALSSNGDGTLTVVHEDSPDKYSVALDTSTHDVYLVTAEFEEQPPAKEGDRPRRTMKKDSFTLLVMGKK